jgi:hypothetical protein
VCLIHNFGVCGTGTWLFVLFEGCICPISYIPSLLVNDKSKEKSVSFNGVSHIAAVFHVIKHITVGGRQNDPSELERR